MTVKATYLLTIEGPGDFDFDLEDAALAIGDAIECVGYGEVVGRVELFRVEGAAIERNRISATSVETRVTSPWSVQSPPAGNPGRAE